MPSNCVARNCRPSGEPSPRPVGAVVVGEGVAAEQALQVAGDGVDVGLRHQPVDERPTLGLPLARGGVEVTPHGGIMPRTNVGAAAERDGCRVAHAPPDTPGQSAKRRPVMRSYAVT